MRTAEPLIVLSLGAGVQSSALALMCARGEIEPMPYCAICAIFADTGAEPAWVYQWLDHLEALLPFAVYRVKQGKGLLSHVKASHVKASIAGSRFAGAPFFTESPSARRGQLRRQCTREFKVEPIIKKLREVVGSKERSTIGGAWRAGQAIHRHQRG